MSQLLLFHRDFRFYTGGHGKAWNYFEHADAHPDWVARAYLTPASVACGNPWCQVPAQVEMRWQPGGADALFLGGTDWDAWPRDDPARPVINLVQHVRHADPTLPLRRHLSRRAVRICVGSPVADAILATGEVNGPVLVIPAALDLAPAPITAGRHQGIFIDALKQPGLGQALLARLRSQGRDANLIIARQPRADYLAQLAAASIAVMLPHESEGFYLPALEAMALGCAVVVPDCVGNRAYLEPGRNALVPGFEVDALAAAILRLDDSALSGKLVAAGADTASRFDLRGERAAFHAVLDDLDALWRS